MKTRALLKMRNLLRLVEEDRIARFLSVFIPPIRGFDYDLALVNSLLNFYAKTGFVGYAHNLFRGMARKDVISWSCMMACCVKNEMAGEALNLFHEMVEKRLEFNFVTLG
ncbi:hypothetical protein Scep_014232 [Stephania cephalantha]|uniref:Pentatricopeptide repeat-containing protein n=1 Tax=Stephania cephalantha TaxID=152367 RepID=A0AAP0J3E6_9MAGN